MATYCNVSKIRVHLTLVFLLASALGCTAAVEGGEPGETVAQSEQALLGSGVKRTYEKLHGFVAGAPGGDFNQCVPRVDSLLTRLNARGELMGLHYSSAGYADLDGETWHVQGIVRLPFYESDWLLRGQFFAADFSHPMGGGHGYGAAFGMAQLGFTGGKEGEAIGGNRSHNYNWLPTQPWASPSRPPPPSPYYSAGDWLVVPNPDDTFVSVNGQAGYPIDQNQNHPGGMSGIGWHVVVPFQKFRCGVFEPFLDCETPADSDPWVRIYDLWWPQNPVLKSSFLTKVRPVPPGKDGNSAMAAAITKLADGRFLLAVVKDAPEGVTEFYLSTGTDLDAANPFGADRREPDAVWPVNRGWSNMNFLTECDTGELYLLGMKADDFVYLRKVEFFEGRPVLAPPPPTNGIVTVQLDAPDPPYRAEIGDEASKQMYCSDATDHDQCNMDAAAGSYVDPNGNVIIYSFSHDNDGATSGTIPYVHGNGNPWFGNYPTHRGFLRGMEFRERDGALGHNANCPTLADAWVEFYEHADYNDHGRNPGRLYRIDYSDRDSRNSKRFDVNRFDNKTSSIRYCIPLGHSFKIYGDYWSGPSAYLQGASQVRTLPNFTVHNLTYTYGGGVTNDSISSGHFAENYVDPNGWVGWIDGTW